MVTDNDLNLAKMMEAMKASKHSRQYLEAELSNTAELDKTSDEEANSGSNPKIYTSRAAPQEDIEAIATMEIIDQAITVIGRSNQIFKNSLLFNNIR